MGKPLDEITSPFAAIWPNGQLSEAEWRQRVEDLAIEAEAMIGRHPSPQQLCRLAAWWMGVCWPAMSPQVIAASCRASLLPGMAPGVVVAEGLPDQLDEIRDRLDAIYEAAGENPDAMVVHQKPPQIYRPPSEAELISKPGRWPKTEPRPTLRTAAERMKPRPAPPEPAQQLEALGDDQQLEHLDHLKGFEHLEHLEGFDHLQHLEDLEPPEPIEPHNETKPHNETEPPEPEHLELSATPRRRRATPPPPGWFSQAELAELLDSGKSTVSRWRQQGLAGDEGTDWVQSGRSYFYAPELAESLLQQAAATAAAVTSTTTPPGDPERWLTSAEVAAWFGMSQSWLARARRIGQLQEGVHCRKGLPGEFPGDPYRSSGMVHDKEPTFAALAAITGRAIPSTPAVDPAKARQAAKDLSRTKGRLWRASRGLDAGSQELASATPR